MRYSDPTSLVLDIIGEIPPPVQPEVEEYVGLNVFDHKTGCTLHIPRDRQVAKKLIADSKRNTYGSHLNRQFDSK